MNSICHNGIRIAPNTDLVFAMLVCEDDEGRYEPIDVVSTLAEALEIAQDSMHSKMSVLGNDGDPGICPARYVIWIRGRGTCREQLVYFDALDWSIHSFATP